MNDIIPKADYSIIANSYDAARKLPDSSIEQWVDIIRNKGKIKRDSYFLDLGCGTGRFTIPTADSTGAFTIGADLSADMLSAASVKTNAGNIKWVQCNALSLPYRPGVFQCIFMSMLIHHIDDQAKVLGECYRILRDGGSCLIRTCAHEDMYSMPVYRFFPRAYRIDKARLPDIGDLKKSLLAAGFRYAEHVTVMQELVSSVDQYIDKMRRKAISTLTFLTDDEFEEGLARLEEHFNEAGDTAALDEVSKESITLVYAVK